MYLVTATIDDGGRHLDVGEVVLRRVGRVVVLWRQCGRVGESAACWCIERESSRRTWRLPHLP